MNAPVDIIELENLEQRTVAAPWAQLGGTVVSENTKPAAGVTVVIRSKEANLEYKVVTDKNGQYTYIGLPAGEYLVGVLYAGKFGLPREFPLSNGDVRKENFDLRFFEGVEGADKLDFEGLKAKFNSTDDPSDAAPQLSSELQKLYDQAKDAVARGDLKAAAALLKELVEKAPGEANLWRQLGECYLEIGQLKDAAAAFRKAIELKPEVAQHYGLLALTLLFIGDVEEAVRVTEKTAALDKHAGADAYYNLGLWLTDAGAVARAEAAFTKATELDDRHSDAYFQLGITLLSTRSDLREARKPLERFLSLAPEGEDALTASALITEIDKGQRR
jgi:tetratricopeptide (TPR) repeat protein